MKLTVSPFARVSFAMMVGVMSTALISPLYALYKETWQLQASDISLIYVIYMAGALLGLLCLGRVADRVGFQRVLQGGLVLTFAGTLLSLLAWNLASLNVGRFIVGVAASMVTTSAALGLSKLSSAGNAQRVAMMTGFLMALGFGLGPLMGGITGQWAPLPLVTTYIPTLVLVAVALFALHRLPLPHEPRPHGALRAADLMPRLTWPGRASSSAFVLTCGLPFLTFCVFGLYASMAPLFLDKLLPWHGPIVSGGAIAIILIISAISQMLAGRMPTHWCGFLGLVGLALSNALLMANLWLGSASLFTLGVLFAAQGHGMSLLAGMSMVGRLASPANHGGLFSTYLVGGYLGAMVPIMAVGMIADHWGMEAAICAFGAVVIVLGLALALFFLRHPRVRGSFES
jgi:MFS family permease